MKNSVFAVLFTGALLVAPTTFAAVPLDGYLRPDASNQLVWGAVLDQLLMVGTNVLNHILPDIPIAGIIG